MLEIVLWGVIFVLSLTVLLKASDYFTDSAEEIGVFFKLPSFIIGVTIVALGTSLPELVSSFFAIIQGYPEIVSGNVVGSNITNIFLILGAVALFSTKNRFSHDILSVDLPILFGSTILISVAMYDGVFSFWEGVLSLAGLFLFVLHTIKSSNRGTAKDKKEMAKDVEEAVGFKTFKNFPIKSLIVLVGSAVFIFIGAKYTIDSIVKISEIIKISPDIIAASVVALGTSLPELAVSYIAAKKGNLEIAVGNVLGSNIFNSLAVMGIPALMGSFIVPENILKFGVPMMVIATFMYIFITQDKKITKWEGSFLLIFYVFYVAKLFNLI